MSGGKTVTYFDLLIPIIHKKKINVTIKNNLYNSKNYQPSINIINHFIFFMPTKNIPPIKPELPIKKMCILFIIVVGR